MALKFKTYGDYSHKRISNWKKFKQWLKPKWWDHFWYDYNWDGVYGYGSKTTKIFKEDRLALVVSIFILFCFIGYIAYLLIFKKQ